MNHNWAVAAAMWAGCALLASAACAEPLVAVIGDNAGTEVTDYVVPYGVLSASGAAEVVDVAVYPGPLHLMPALTLDPTETIASFDARHPAGADYVIVPAMHRAAEPSLLRWLRTQAQQGATIVGVCDGVWVVANAGLLDGHFATGHWYSLPSLEKQFPRTHWLRDRRWVRDGPIITTTGVSASLPVALELVREIAGRERADALARELGVAGWNAAHESDRYRLTSRHVATAAANLLGFWRYEDVGIPIAAGVDEISLSFTADALGRTYRTNSVILANGAGPIVSKRGLSILPDSIPGGRRLDHVEEPPSGEQPARALDRTLQAIAERYGMPTARFVALQLEYPWPR